MTMNDISKRPIRSFVRREGRITKAQKLALEQLWIEYGVEFTDQYLDLSTLFNRQAETVIEIGFGDGDSFIKMAAAHPDVNYLGIEVYRPGVGSCLEKIKAGGLTNVRLISEDAVDVLNKMVPDNSISKILLFFPDPWPKKRHHKRRILKSSFLDLVCSKLNDDGIFHMATDWQDYAEQALDVLNSYPGLNNLSTDNAYVDKPDYRPETKFERRGIRLGHDVWDIMFSNV